MEHAKTPAPRWSRLAVWAAVGFIAGVITWNVWGA